MRKIVLTFGLISGAVMVAMFLLGLPFHDRIGNDGGMLIGYTTMVAASLLIYFGVRRYRDTIAGGRIRFGWALLVGALIGAVSGASSLRGGFLFLCAMAIVLAACAPLLRESPS